MKTTEEKILKKNDCKISKAECGLRNIPERSSHLCKTFKQTRSPEMIEKSTEQTKQVPKWATLDCCAVYTITSKMVH